MLFSLPGLGPRPALPLLLAGAWCFFATFAQAALPKPTGLKASTTKPAATAQNGAPLRWFTVSWNATQGPQNGFLIQARLGSQGPFTSVYAVQARETEGSFALNGQAITVGAKVQFRVYTFLGEPVNPAALSPSSEIVEVTIPEDKFLAPTSLTAVAMDNGVVKLSWQDNSTTEEYFAVEMKRPEDEDFRHLGSLLFNKTEVDITGFDTPNVERRFRVRAWRGSLPAVGANASGNGTAYSNVALVTTKNLFQNEEIGNFGFPYDKPWLSPVEKETNWQEPYRIEIQTTSPNDRTSLTAANLPPGLSFNGETGELFGTPTTIGRFTTTFTANFTNAASINGTFILNVRPPRVSSRAFEPATRGTPFSFTFNTTSSSARISANLTGEIPPGMAYDSGNLTLSGTPTEAGVFRMAFTPVFTGYNGSVSQNFTLRIRPPNDSSPELFRSYNSPQLGVGGQLELDLAEYYRDPDAGAAVRLETTSGPLDILLYPDSTPQTVANFLRYVEARDYDGTVFHRLIPGFVLQGGGFYPVAAPNRFFSVAARPSPLNEPGISNLRGTVAMAKVSGQPNSATTNFFFNLANNSENLDNQNEGFTVFGRLAQGSLPVLDDLAAKPRYTIPVLLGTGNNQENMSDWPFTESLSAPVAMNQSKLLKIHRARRISPLTFTIEENSAPEVVEASLDGSLLRLRSLSPGEAIVRLKIEDRDGHYITQNMSFLIHFGARHFRAGEPGVIRADLSESPGWAWQWEKDGRPLRGANQFVLNLPAARLADAGTYVLVGTDPTGEVTRSNPIVVGVLEFPDTPLSVRAGQTGTLSAKFAGPGFTLQWRRNGEVLTDQGQKIRGATTGTLRVTSFQTEDSGIYQAELLPPLAPNTGRETRGLTVSRQVSAVTGAPLLRTPFVPTAPVRQNYSLTLSWDEFEQTRPASVSVSGLPPGLTFNATTGVISGVPTRSGNYTLRVIARNVAGVAQTVNLPLNVSAIGPLGEFQALVPRQAEWNQNLGGLLSLTTTADGAFSGFLRLGGTTHRFRGGLLSGITNSAASFSVNLPRKNAPAISLSGNLSTTSINATLSQGNQSLTLAGFRAVTPTGFQYSRFHTHMALADDDPEADSLPEGEGFFVVEMISPGPARVTGVLPDGTAVTSSFPLLNGGRYLWQQNLSSGGSLLMNATASFVGLNATSRSSINGTINWSRTSTKPGFSPQTFAPKDFRWQGRRYVVPDGTIFKALDLGGNQTSQTLRFLGSEVAASNPAPEIPLSWTPQNRFQISPNPHALSLSLNLRTGLFSGSFAVRDGTAPNQVTRRGTYRGLWIPFTGGRGFFLLPMLDDPKVRTSGAVELDPGPTP